MPKFVIRAPRYVDNKRIDASPSQPRVVEIHKRFLVNHHAVDDKGKPCPPRDFTEQELARQGLVAYKGGDVPEVDLKMHFASKPDEVVPTSNDIQEVPLEEQKKKGRPSDKEL